MESEDSPSTQAISTAPSLEKRKPTVSDPGADSMPGADNSGQPAEVLCSMLLQQGNSSAMWHKTAEKEITFTNLFKKLISTVISQSAAFFSVFNYISPVTPHPRRFPQSTINTV